jgi:hypothetical protein
MEDPVLKIFNGGDGFGSAPTVYFKGHILEVATVVEILSI